MAFTTLHQWLTGTAGYQRKHRPRQRFALHVEILEDRTVPSTLSLGSQLDGGAGWLGTGILDTHANANLATSLQAKESDSPTNHASGLTELNLPDAAADGITTATSRNAKSQAPNHSPVFQSDGTVFVTAYTHPEDPLAVKLEAEDGTVLEYFAEKNPDGTVVRITHVKVTNPDESVTHILFDEQGRPTKIFTADGFQELLWLSDTEYVHTVLVKDGDQQVQVSLSVNLETGEIGEGGITGFPSTVSAGQGSVGSRSTSTTGQVRLVSSGPAELSMASTNPDLLSSAQNLIVDTASISVTRCEQPVENAIVEMLVIPVGAVDESRIIPATHVGGGVYEVQIPTEPSTAAATFETICDTTASAIGALCFFGAEIGPAIAASCPALAAAASALATPAAGAAVLGACEGFAVAYMAICSTAGASPGPGTPNVAELLCSTLTEVVESFSQQFYTLAPSATVAGVGKFQGTAMSATAGQPFPTFQIDIAGTTEIVSFTTNPVDPAPFQDYVATAKIVCPNSTEGTLVTISIVGTDGYSDSTSMTIFTDSSINLFVPGGDEGVIDTVTVAIDSGPSRTVVLVF